jgi:membrane protease YdiL (CAAX protease family)
VKEESQRELAVYFALAYAISWLVWLPLVFGSGGVGLLHVSPPNVVTLFSGSIELPAWLMAGTFGPTAAALITQRLFGGRMSGFSFFTALRPMIKGFIVGALCILIVRWLIPALAVTCSGFDRWDWEALTYIRYYFLPSLLVGPLGEEPGWRGFALPRMQSMYGPSRASLVLGVLWSGWHLPLFLLHGWSSAPVWAFFAINTSLSVFMTFGHNLSRGSVLVAILLHTVHNSAGAPLHMFLDGAALRGHFDEITACSFLVGAAVLMISTTGHLGRNAGIAPSRKG